MKYISIFFWLGVIMLGIAAFVFVREQSFLSKASTATGTVVNLDMSGGSNGTSFCPVIDFTTSSGQKVRYYGNVCTNPPMYDIGQQIEVLYDGENVKTVQMKNFFSQYVGVLVWGLIGLTFAGAGAWMMRRTQ